MSTRRTPAARLDDAHAYLSSGDLAALGLSRSQVDSIFRGCPVIKFPETRRPLIRVRDFQALVAMSTYDSDRVR